MSMETGCFGSVAFRVSRSKIKTFSTVTHTAAANYSTHQRADGTPLLEFTGAQPDKVTMTALLSEYLGASPMGEYNRLLRMMKSAQADTLVIGDHLCGDHLWVLTALTMTAKYFDKWGNITSCDVSFTLQEYYES